MIHKNIELKRYSLKFLSEFMKSDVLVDIMSRSTSKQNGDDTLIAKNNFNSIENNINDLDHKVALVKNISSFIHD